MNDDRNDLLRRTLRDGDPAEGDPGLTPDEIRAMRRTMLTAIPETRRRIAWVPFLVTGAAALIALLIAVLLGPGRSAPESPRPVEQAAVHPVAPPAAVTPAAPSPETAVPDRPAAKQPERQALRRRPIRPQMKEPAPPEPPVQVAAATTELREIQFSTPGGTRIIWIISPDNAL